MKKTCLIRQPAGIGDIFFCQKIAAQYRKYGYDVIWPVIPEFLWVKDYMKWNQYVLDENDFEGKELYVNSSVRSITSWEETEEHKSVFLPLHGHRLLDESVMKSKYKLVEEDWEDWADYFEFERKPDKEENLYRFFLNLKEGEEYNFVNNMFASPPHVQTRDIPVNNNLRTVHMRFIEGFTLFDWCKVIENAANIYTVETSLNYIIEKLDIKAKDLKMYSKWSPPDFHHIESLFKKPWEYIK